MAAAQGFLVKEYYWGKDPFLMESRSHTYRDFDNAIVAAERSWEVGNGDCEKVCVVDSSALQFKKMPHVLWWRHRAEDWIPLVHEGDRQLLVPDEREAIDEYSYLLPQGVARIVSDDRLLEELVDRVSINGDSVTDALRTAWEKLLTIHRLIGLPLTIHFDGLAVKDDLVEIYIRTMKL